MQMAQPFPPHGGMAPGHPGIPHGQPMGGMQHPGAGHMGGHPGPGMMQGMHPVVSGPQVTQGPMVTGMPPGVATSAPGGPMPNAHAMAHIGPGQQPMFPQQHMNFGQMPPLQQQQMLQRRQQMALMQQAQQQHQQHGMPMTMPNGQMMNQAQIAQMKANMMPQNLQQMQMAVANPQNFQQQQAHMLARQQAQAAMQAHRANQAAQMQISRSQEPTTQPPQPHPTPAPQNQPQPPSQPTPQPQPQNQAKQPQTQAANVQQQQPLQARTQQGDQSQQTEEPDIHHADLSEDLVAHQTMNQDFSGRMILHLLHFQERLQSMEKPNQIESWEDFVSLFFSPLGFVRQQVFNIKNKADKRFQIPYAALARFFYSHFSCGIKKMIMSTFDCRETALQNGVHHVWSNNASLTYVYASGIRVTTTGSVQVNFDAMNKIEHLAINTSDWSEYIPRNLLQPPESPDQKQDMKMNKNLKRQQTKIEPGLARSIPNAVVGDNGLPGYMVQMLEVCATAYRGLANSTNFVIQIVEVMTNMGPLFEYYHNNNGISPREALAGVVAENSKRQAQMSNQMALAMNGQIHPGQRPPGMNGPNQFQSPGLAHLGPPQVQGSPHLGGPVHTPSPAQNHVGGVAMMHQMSQQGSNLSGSQGPSTNTSPNVSHKRRRASQIKTEDDSGSQEANGANKMKPSPQISKKRQKGTQ